MRRIAALLPLALMALSWAHYKDDARAREPILENVSRFTIDVRRPFETELIGYAPSADMAAQVLAISAIGDALGTVRLTNLSLVEQRAWLDVPIYLQEELDAATEQSLMAMSRNPGWPLHWYLLGKLAYTSDRRSLGGEVEPDKWLTPLKSAYTSARGHEPVVETLAGVMIEASSLLSEKDRQLVPDVLHDAFVDPRFVRVAFNASVETAGREVAFRALPDAPAPLLEGTRALGRAGDLPGAYQLHERWERAEWTSRTEDLEEMRTRLARGDWRGLLGASTGWASKHSVHEFDNEEGLRQVEEVLRLWPKDQIGAWSHDRRAEIVRFFLDGRRGSIDPQVLAATLGTLTGVPAPTKARVALASGDVTKAERLVRQAGSEGGFEWTDYFVDLARRSIDDGDIEAALDAIDRISPSARNECDVRIVRREAGEELEAPEVSVTDESGQILDEAWSTNGMLGICVDPITNETTRLVIDLETEGPAIVEWGLNTGRRDTFLSNGSSRIAVPLSGMTGRNVFYARVLWGAAITERRARIE